MGQWVGWQEQVAALADRKDYLREMLASADGIITQAPLVYEILLREGIPPEQMHLVPYGLDLSGWKALKPARAEDGCLRIGYLGSLTPAKGAHKLISAFRRLCDPHGIRLQLRLHGSMTVLPQYTQALRKLAHGDPRIVFAGRYENSDVESILDEVDVLVVPSLWYEIGPLVTLEALASRTPVVVGNIPNMKYQIRDGVDGLHYEVDRVAELTRQLQRFLDEPGLVSQLRSGIEDVKTSDQEFSEWSEIYQHVLTQVR
jgi:glycosyltransferase involved in cell wall biosynthesis